MKKLILASIGLITMSVCNAYAAALCNDYGDAIVLGNSTLEGAKQLVAGCTINTVYGDAHCETLDYNLTFVWRTSDGKCYYQPSCASCPSGYELNKEPIEYTVGDLCYIGDGNKINGNTQDMLDKQPNEYYQCTKIPTSCATGYWGTPSGNNTGCNPCPSAGNIYANATLTTEAEGTSTAGQNTSITDCYIKAGTYYDATGTFVINNCFYKK